MNYINVSAGVIIDKVFRDFDIDSEHWIADGYEWLGEAIEHIGCIESQIEKSIELEVESYCAQLPFDIISIQNAWYRTTSDKDDNYSLISNKNNRDEEGFFINDGYVYTHFEEGTIGFRYYAIPLGEDGLPRIPDLASVKEAITWYILSKLILRGFKHPSTEINYQFALNQWKHYATQARARISTPDVPTMDRMLLNWTRMAQTSIRLNYAIKAESGNYNEE